MPDASDGDGGERTDVGTQGRKMTLLALHKISRLSIPLPSFERSAARYNVRRYIHYVSLLLVPDVQLYCSLRIARSYVILHESLGSRW
jgi:hypothetical protein